MDTTTIAIMLLSIVNSLYLIRKNKEAKVEN